MVICFGCTIGNYEERNLINDNVFKRQFWVLFTNILSLNCKYPKSLEEKKIWVNGLTNNLEDSISEL